MSFYNTFIANVVNNIFLDSVLLDSTATFVRKLVSFKISF